LKSTSRLVVTVVSHEQQVQVVSERTGGRQGQEKEGGASDHSSTNKWMSVFHRMTIIVVV